VRAAAAAATIAASGCISFGPGNDEAPLDGGPDAEPCAVVSRYPVDPCAPTLGDLFLATPGVWRYDSTLEELRDPSDSPVDVATTRAIQSDGQEVSVIRAAHIAVASGAVLRIAGDRVVYLVAGDDIDVSGTIDASADGRTPGPSAQAAGDCPGEPGGTGMDTGGGGGGGGGLEVGAGGGPGDGIAGGAGGAAFAFTPDRARGGCDGGDGGGGCAPLSEGGAGGGAVVLIAAGEIRVGGAIDTGGGGGRGGELIPLDCGGGGGGSGGYIGLDAPRALVLGRLSATGGGGGGGGVAVDPGEDGQDGETTGGLGGSGGGGDGGGSSTAAPSPGVGTNLGGGGGGGGSTGVIYVPAGAEIDSANIIPAPREV
jgi:hypothetical protein